jgi:4,5-DOPA dioxygenase extradiol
MPAAFVGHGTPMNALERNRFTERWAEFGRSFERPRAVLSISAHWFIDATAVTAMDKPRVIHDFYGFPQALFDVDYPAPGAPDVARQVADLLSPARVGLDEDSWGLDHGTWSVLRHVFPDADVPVVQLSVNAGEPLEYHLGLGAKLAPLLDDGITVIASGNIVHNLRRINWQMTDAGYDWAQRFDDDARAIVATSPEEIGRLQEHFDYAAAVPTPDHFLPAVYFAGITAALGATPRVLVEGCTMGSLSMTSYVTES